MQPSPFVAIQYLYLALEFGLGDQRDIGSPIMRWDRLRFNLPGDPLFDPSLPFVMKWNDLTNKIAGDMQSFVDDLRTFGHSVENIWQVSRQIIAARVQYLGIQDSPRKRRPRSQRPGAWAGFMISASPQKGFQNLYPKPQNGQREKIF